MISKHVSYIMVMAFLVCALILNWQFRQDGYHYLQNVSIALLLGIVLKQIPLLEISLQDMIFQIAVLLIGQALIPKVYFPQINIQCLYPLMLLLLISLLLKARVFHKEKARNGITIVFSTIICTIIYFLYQNAQQILFSYYLTWGNNLEKGKRAMRVMVFVVIVYMITVVSVWLITNITKNGLIKLQEYSEKYKEIDRSAILVLALILCCLIMTELLTFASGTTDFALPVLWIGMCTIIVLIQVIYIRLLLKSISLKEEMRLQESDWQKLSKYNQELESSMEELRAVKHDIKNLFLTMGGFVEKSNDEEMKAFYEKNIVPFAAWELEKSDLYTKLAHIHDESMKSFLYFKIMQGMEQSIKMELQIEFENETMGFCMAQTDLIRILGIFIDNAMEEAKACNGNVTIQIKETKKEYDFLIRNSTREQTRSKGVLAGTTDKGLGRGEGLLIAQKTINKYKNILLNSFFQQEEFVQYLRIKKV